MQESGERCDAAFSEDREPGVCFPAETDPEGDAGGCSGGGRCVREERAGDEGDLGFIYCHCRAGDHEGSGPGHGAAGGGGVDDGGAVRVG